MIHRRVPCRSTDPQSFQFRELRETCRLVQDPMQKSLFSPTTRNINVFGLGLGHRGTLITSLFLTFLLR